MRKRKETKFVRVEVELLEQIEKIAEEMSSSLTWAVNYILREELKKRAEKENDN